MQGDSIAKFNEIKFVSLCLCSIVCLMAYGLYCLPTTRVLALHCRLQSCCEEFTIKVKNKRNLLKMINLYSTTQCFNHFKCMICQVEIHSRQATIFHAKTKIHKKNRKLYSVVEKSTILEKLLEATQKDKEERLEKQSNLILRCRPYPFIQILSQFYPDFTPILFSFNPNFFLILFRFFKDSLYPNFIQILFGFSQKIWIKIFSNFILIYQGFILILSTFS